MVGKVLRSHDIVSKEKDIFSLEDFDTLTKDEIDELINLEDEYSVLKVDYDNLLTDYDNIKIDNLILSQIIIFNLD